MAGTFHFLDVPLPTDLIKDALKRLEAGEAPSAIESTRFDFKEDPTRRSGDGQLQPGLEQSGAAARKFAAEVAAMANTPDGGAFLIGINDKTGEIIGTELEAEWLERRIHELLGDKVSLRVWPVKHTNDGAETKLLAIGVDYAHQPIEFDGKIQKRLKERKVTVTPTEALTARFAAMGVDPSAQPTTRSLSDVSSRTIEALRATLRDAGQRQSAQAPLTDIAARLGLLSDDQSYLNQAGVLLLADRQQPRLDYQHRQFPGSTADVERINLSNTSLLVELRTLTDAVERHNVSSDVVLHGIRRTYGSLPQRSAREAIVNGVAHRDWAPHAALPTVVEHIGHQLRVTSPGGLVDGITTDNILTHSSKPRYATLLSALRGLGLAEQQGIGIDTIHRELITIGAPPPEISATADEVVVVLQGRSPDQARIEFFNSVQAPGTGDDHAAAVEDVDFALIIDRLCDPRSPWATTASCARVLHRTPVDTNNALDRLTTYTSNARPIFTPVRVPKATPAAWTLTKPARQRLAIKPSPEEIEQAIVDWSVERGRISSSEYLGLFAVSQPTATKRLQELESAGLLAASTTSRAGQGFHYTLAASSR